MPKVYIAQPTGFCFGVKKAIRLAENGLKRYRRVWTYGELVHNPQVLKQLFTKGIKPVRRLAEAKDGVLVIRAHGCPKSVLIKCNMLGIPVIDATCPYVRRVQNVARCLAEDGYQVVVVGEKDHPEVKAILAAAGKGALVITSEERAGKLGSSIKKKLGVVAQTTMDNEGFKAVVARLSQFGYNELRVFNTICAEVSARQEATARLAKKVDAVVVVGGKNSANTRRLAQIVRGEKRPVVHIAEPKELQPQMWQKFRRIGIVAGASTPAEVVAEIARILTTPVVPVSSQVARPSFKEVVR